MAIFERVRAGDVISSDFFNSLLDKMTELESRITSLEHGGGTTQEMIDHFDPPAQVQAGQVLTLFGSFDFPVTNNTVTVDGNPVLGGFRPGSNNVQLIFQVPSITVPTEGKNVIIKVTNRRGSDQKSYRLLPAAVSTLPAPSITSVVDLASSTALLRTGQTARITGTNFATTATENIIRFRIQVGGSTITYPKAGQTLTLDPAQTNQSQIVVTVPVITEVGVGNSVPATLEVGVGATVPAAVAVTILRIS